MSSVEGCFIMPDASLPTDYYRVPISVPTLASNRILNVNEPLDISLGPGEIQIFEFIATKQKEHRIFTGPYAGVGGSNDTVLEIYSDAGLNNLVAINDDYDGTYFSSITFIPTPGQKYYIKLRTYSSSASLYCRITALLPEPTTFSENSAHYVYNSAGRLTTTYYASGRQMIFIYDNNGNLLRKILLD